MSNNHLNDISRVYLAQVAEETPGERIDRKSKEGVANTKAKADAEKQARAKKAAEFQKHKNSVLAKGGRHVDAIDSWHSKEAYERNAILREEVKCSKKGKKSTKSSVAQDPVENDQVVDQLAGMMSSESYMSKDKEGHTTGGFRISNKEASAAKKRVKAKSAGQELAKREKDDDAFGAPNTKTEGWKPDPVEKRKKKAADLHRRETIASATPAKYKTDKTEDPDKLYKRRMAVDSKTKIKKESFSDWRNDLREIVSEPEEKAEKEVTEKKVKNKVVINPTFQEAINDIGGEVLDAVELDEVKVTRLDDKKKKEERDKKVKAMLARQAEWESGKKKALHASHEPEGENLDEKDSYKTVAAVIDYDRAKKGSKDATYDSDHGKKKAAKKERDYAAWEREKMKRDDPNWKHKKYHTGMHGESVEADEYIETVKKVKKAELDADIKRWSVEEGKCDDCTCEGCGPDGVGHEDPCVECGGHHKLDEAVKGQDTQDRKDAAAERRKGVGKLLSKKEGEKNADKMERDVKFYAKLTKKGRVDEQLDDKKKEDPLKKRENHIKKQVLIKKLQALRTGGTGITASYEPEGEVIDETLTSVKAASFGMPHKERKELIDKYKKNELKKGKQPVKAPIQKEEVISEKDLSAAERRALPNKEFALPGKGKGPEGKQAGSYPIPDEKHARSALSLVSQHGTPEEKSKVRAKVAKKFPGIKVSEDAAFQNVVSMLQKKHGKGGVITKDNPPKPPTPAEKEASKKHREKISSQRKRQSMSDVVRSYRRAGESD